MYDTSQFLREAFQGAEMDYIYILELGAAGKRQRFLTIEQALEYCENIPSQVHVYYGVYARHSHSGKAKAATTTGCLWADYDGMDMPTVMERIGAAGLPKPSVVVSSGHGWHCYWLLAERVGRQALRVVKALATATGADSKATDRARVMRLPGSYNLKSVPIKCEIVEVSWARYELAAIMTALGICDESGETIDGQPVEAFIDEIRRSPMPCVSALAGGVPKGHRNPMLGRITKDLQRRGFTKDTAWGVVVRWNRLNKPPENADMLRTCFDAYWRGSYKLLGCVYNNPDLQAMLANYCSWEECCYRRRGVTGEFNLEQTVSLNNRVLNPQKRKLRGTDLITLCVLLRHDEGLTTARLLDKLTPRSEEQAKPCIARKTLLGCLRRLQAHGFVRTIDRLGCLGAFHVAVKGGTYGQGLTQITNGAVNGAIDGRVSPAEFRLYALLLRYAQGKGEAFPGLKRLAAELRVTEANISKQLKGLERADYIKLTRGYNNNPDKLLFTLLV